MKMEKQDNQITIREIAIMLGISKTTVYEYLKKSSIEPVGRIEVPAVNGASMMSKVYDRQEVIDADLLQYSGIKSLRYKSEKYKHLKPVIIPRSDITNELELTGNDTIGILKDIRELLVCLLEGQELQVKGMLDMRKSLLELSDALGNKE